MLGHDEVGDIWNELEGSEVASRFTGLVLLSDFCWWSCQFESDIWDMESTISGSHKG